MRKGIQEVNQKKYGGTLEEILGLAPEDYFDFELRSIWDVARLFCPYMHDDFQEDFHAHDATNLLNLLGAISSDNSMRGAADRAREARNKINHKGPRMTLDEFKGALAHIYDLADRAGGRRGKLWEQVHAMSEVVQRREDGDSR